MASPCDGYNHKSRFDPSLEIAEVETAPATGHGVAVESERIEKVEQDIQTLRNDLAELKREFQEFKNRFE